MATGPEHYLEAERMHAAADEWADADLGWKANLTAQERINQRLADLTDALVHATLAQAAATALAARPEGMYDLDYEAWDRIAGVQDDDHDDEVEDDEANADPDLIGAMARHTSTHGTAAVYDMADPHDAALAEDQDGDENHFSRAQLDGEACTECGAEFAVGEPTVPSAYDFAEGQLFAHAAHAESEA